MPIIYSGNRNDQNYSSAYKRLVRQSNRARDDFPDGVHPTVKQWMDGFHQIGAMGSMKGLWLPADLSVADAENRVSEVKGLTQAGSMDQSTGANQPHLTRADERMNLALQSVFPGSGSSPTGWSIISGSGSLVAGTDGHQNYTTASGVVVAQVKPVLTGQKYLFAVRAEVAASSQTSVVSISGVSTSTLASFRNMGPASDGEWLWVAFNVDSGGDANLTVVISENDEVSRPMLAYLPPGLDLENNAEVQQWLTDHYAATTTVREYAGGPNGERVIHFDGVDHWMHGPVMDFGENDDFSVLVKLIHHGGGATSVVNTSWTEAGSWSLFARPIQGTSRITMRATSGGAFFFDGDPVAINQWSTLGFSYNGATGKFDLYVNGVGQGGPTHNKANGGFDGGRPMIFGARGNSAGTGENGSLTNISVGGTVISDDDFSPDKFAALHEILTGA